MSNAMDDIFGRRNHRPNHPDFWRISEIILANDGAIEQAPDKETVWKERTSSVVDIDSVTYMATQRALLAFGPPGTKLSVAQQATAAALVIDAFVAGVMFAERGGHQETPQ